MTWLNRLFDFYIKSSLHVAVCFAALAGVYNETYGFYVSLTYYIFLFCGALSGYNLIKYGFLWLKTPVRVAWLIKIITSVAMLVALWCTWDFGLYAWFLLLITIIISLVYVLPIWKGKGLRYSPFFKLFSVSIVWALLIIAIPQFLQHDPWITSMVRNESSLSLKPSDLIELHTLKIFILVLALCIPFEIRDLKYDDKILHTLPQVLGVKSSKKTGLILCLLYMTGIFYDFNLSEQFQIMEFIVICVLALSIWFSDKFKTDYYASFFVEAIPLLWFGLHMFYS